MTITNGTELRETYLHVFDSFATTPSDIVDEVDGVSNVRFARELLGTLVQAGLVAETEGDEGAVWQTCPDTYDSIDRDEAERRIDNWLNNTNTTEEKKMSAAPKTAPSTKSEGYHPCYCGCGENVPQKSFYRPGHDARHAGNIGRLVASTRNEAHFNDLPSERLVIKAKGIAAKALEKELAKQEREAKKNAPEVVEGTLQVGKKERIGRKFKDGTVEYMGDDGEWKPASKTAASTFTE